MAFLDPIFNPWLLPLLNWNPLVGILLLSFVLTLLITIVYKYFTNQEEMKRIKDEQKEFQRRMKELKDKPDELMKLQKEAMGRNMDYMKHSLKATLITMLPIIVMLGWMTAHLSFEPIYPGETYSVSVVFKQGVQGNAELLADEGTQMVGNATQAIEQGRKGTASWKLKSAEGEHYLTVKLGEVQQGEVQQSKKVYIGKELRSEPAFTPYPHSDIEQIRIDYHKLRPLGPEFTVPLFNWQPGWLGLYILFSIGFSVVLRKVLKVY